MIAARMADRAVGVISTLILARLLVPGDFGLIAMATAIGGFLDLLGSFSFDLALIQNKNANKTHYNTVWTFNVIFGAACAAGMILLAHPAANFYSEPRLITVMYVLSLSNLITAFNNIGIVNFRKELNFSQEFKFILIRRVVTFAVTIGAAVAYKSYWALLIGMILGKIVTCAMTYSMNSYRPWFTLSAARELLSFSKWLLLNNFLGFLRHDGCTFVIGRVFGATELGIYTVSYEISNLPTTELVAPINRVTFPGFSKMTTVDLVKDSYFTLLGMIALLIVPIGIGIAAVAEPLVLTALGPKWHAATALIAVLALSGAITSTQTNNSSVWLALGKPHKISFVQAIYLTLLFPSLYFFLHRYGIVGAGYAYVVAQVVDACIQMSISKAMLSFEWSDVTKQVWRPVIACICMYSAVTWFDHIYLTNTLPILRLGIASAFGAVVYIAVILSLWQISSRPSGAESFCLARAKLL